MRHQIWIAWLAVVGGAGHCTASDSAVVFADAEAAYARASAVAMRAEALTADEVAAARAVFAGAQQQTPAARWEVGLAMVAFDAGEWKVAEGHAEKAVELEPTMAEAHYWLGNSLFSGINSAGLLEKGSIASRGRKAYERAVELDPKHVGARYGLAQFFAGAPGIAGGSTKKAREQGEAMIAIEGGGMLGHTVLAQLAGEDKKWDEAEKQFELAADASADAEARAGVQRARAAMLLRKKKDPAAALPIAEALVAEHPDDLSARYLLGLTRQAVQDHAGAAECFSELLSRRPESANALFGLAESQRDAGNLADALASFERFAAEHEKDKRASDAKSEAKKLRKKLAKS